MKPHIYLHVYPSGLRFWRVRRVKKKHSRISAEEGLLLRPAYDFVHRLNDELARVQCPTTPIEIDCKP
jgi:hypothetical protein